jgi:hypothetical protein
MASGCSFDPGHTKGSETVVRAHPAARLGDHPGDAGTVVIRHRASERPIYAARAPNPESSFRSDNSIGIDGRAFAARDAMRNGVALADAELARVSLPGAECAATSFAGANLAGANLAGADLADCNLADAVLAGSNLAGANLTGANLAGANLAGADLTGATLDGASLVDCILDDADLADVEINDANLARARGIIDAGWPGGRRCVAWKRATVVMVLLGRSSMPIERVKRKFFRDPDGEISAAIDYLSRIAMLRGWH